MPVFIAVSSGAARVGRRHGSRAVGPAGKQQMFSPELFFLGNKAASITRWPAVFVIQPSQQLLFGGFLRALLDKRHEFLAQVGSLQTRADMDVETTHSHCLEMFNLPLELGPGELVVPAPKRSAPVFGSWRLK